MAKKKPTKTQRIITSVGREIKKDEPGIIGKTRKKFGAKRALAQKRAILLSKARRRGARLPRRLLP